MNVICRNLAYPTLIDWCKEADYLVIGTGIVLTALTAYGISQCGSLQGRVVIQENRLASTAHPINPDLIKTKSIFDVLYRTFIGGRNRDHSDDHHTFKAEWKELFDELDPEIQDRIVKKDMELCDAAATLKSVDSVPLDSDEQRTKSLSFVRDLLPYTLVSGVELNPLNNQGVPCVLGCIIRDLEEEIGEGKV